MTRAAVLLFRPAAAVAFSVAVPRAAAGIWRGCTKGMYDRYRPELHYMRGPGPNGVKSTPKSIRLIDVP
jgi:hypothetical protein